MSALDRRTEKIAGVSEMRGYRPHAGGLARAFRTAMRALLQRSIRLTGGREK